MTLSVNYDSSFEPAHRIFRRPIYALCHEPSYDQLHSLYNGLRRLCIVPKARLSQATICFFLLGAHDALVHCDIKVRIRMSLVNCFYSLKAARRSHFIVNNILEGMIWLWVPASLVICNDVFAYIWGITLGRTPLIKLSPKKTVEGFVGAFFSTLLFAVFWGTYFMQFEYMICPVRELGITAFSDALTCKPNPVFMWHEWEIWAPLQVFLSTLVCVASSSHSIECYFMVLIITLRYSSADR